jgi:hypothetical protein
VAAGGEPRADRRAAQAAEAAEAAQAARPECGRIGSLSVGI